MAALGALGRDVPVHYQIALIAFWSITPSTAPVNGSLTFTIQDGGVPVEGARIILYYRSNLIEIARGKTNASGVAVIIGLDPTDIGAYMAIVHKPDGTDITPDFHTMVQDSLTAI